MTRNGFLLILLVVALFLFLTDLSFKSERREFTRLPSFGVSVHTPWKTTVERIKNELNGSILVNEILKEVTDVDYYPEWKSFVFKDRESFEKAMKVVKRETGRSVSVEKTEENVEYFSEEGMYFILKVK
ncbi:hypothetical protein TRQ7_00930 [Thermotoga sp. RQ7]|uniref:hypothetical protein n=1 Tax=Thermotoga sp. RQ7 TaxID=126738 RepID=UPI0005A34F03|nr:hypothetical protein [Thermotoga sp. RQ7]AJG40035.1 hypothetical protein TRQ7_00930 [Thermotoga sp. RQ7]MDK2950030.1 hypothetical protein [Thermotoga sp.]